MFFAVVHWCAATLVIAACRDSVGVSSTEAIIRRATAGHDIALNWKTVPLPTETSCGQIDGRIADLEKAAARAELLEQELSLYPGQFIKCIPLRRIVLGAELTQDGKARGALVDTDQSTLYLDVEQESGGVCYLRHVIHHELFHLIDFSDDGLLFEDPQWTALNPDGFHYARDGSVMQLMTDAVVLRNDLVGFTNMYARSGVAEDKAEVFAAMMVFPEWMQFRFASDDIMRNKIERIEALLANLCPDSILPRWRRIRRSEQEGCKLIARPL